jgi:hypothetical protein
MQLPTKNLEHITTRTVRQVPNLTTVLPPSIKHHHLLVQSLTVQLRLSKPEIYTPTTHITFPTLPFHQVTAVPLSAPTPLPRACSSQTDTYYLRLCTSSPAQPSSGLDCTGLGFHLMDP